VTKRLGYYFAGFGIGSLIGLFFSYKAGKDGLLWSSNCGNLCGLLAVEWAERRGFVPTPEDLHRPLSLFPPEEKPKR
jgi:hypothetical protein